MAGGSRSFRTSLRLSPRDPIAASFLGIGVALVSDPGPTREDENLSPVQQGFAIFPIPFVLTSPVRMMPQSSGEAVSPTASEIAALAIRFQNSSKKAMPPGAIRRSALRRSAVAAERTDLDGQHQYFPLSRGGQCFGRFMTCNLTPDSSGRPEGFTEKEFITVMRTGEHIHCAKFAADPICALGPNAPTRQVIPGPPATTWGRPTLRWLCLSERAFGGCTLIRRKRLPDFRETPPIQNYIYQRTSDCPNSGTPQ